MKPLKLQFNEHMPKDATVLGWDRIEIVHFYSFYSERTSRKKVAHNLMAVCITDGYITEMPWEDLSLEHCEGVYVLEGTPEVERMKAADRLIRRGRS
jgi:hypothetical protein